MKNRDGSGSHSPRSSSSSLIRFVSFKFLSWNFVLVSHQPVSSSHNHHLWSQFKKFQKIFMHFTFLSCIFCLL